MAHFVITLENGEELEYTTDPCTLTWGNGARVDLSKFGYTYLDEAPTDNDQIPFSPENPVKGKRHPRILKIQLGLGCNYSCKYCSQGGQKEEGASTVDADNFDLDWCVSFPDKIEFWGGEPLLYWKKLQALVPKIKARFGDVRMSIVTNGTLLTLARVDWLYENGFTMAISHDGPGQAVRGDDPLEDPEMLATWMYAIRKFGERICINSVITEKNYDLLQLWVWFESRLGRVKLNVEDVVTNYGGEPMSDETLKALYESVKGHAESGLALTFPRIRWSMQQFMESLVLTKPLAGSHQVCGMDRKDQLAVDLHGNVLTCQNAGVESGHKIGHVSSLLDVTLDTSHSFMVRENCSNCPVVHLCYGSCMFLQGKEFEASCKASYWYNRALLEGAIRLLTGLKVSKIDGWTPIRARRVIPIKVAKC